MSANLFDDDPARDAEAITAQWVAAQQRRQAQEEEALSLVADLREYLVSVAVSRMLPGDLAEREQAETALVDAAVDRVRDAYELDPEIIGRALWCAVWDGDPRDRGRKDLGACEREARSRLLTMRDVIDVRLLDGER